MTAGLIGPEAFIKSDKDGEVGAVLEISSREEKGLQSQRKKKINESASLLTP